MFKYKNCTGKKIDGWWQIQYDDCTWDVATSLKMALYLCETRSARARMKEPVLS